jgi:uncharacterized membrane protein
VLQGPYGSVVRALIVSNLVSLFLFFVRVFGSASFRFWFLFWNLLLAWVPLALAVLLVKNLRRHRWKSWQNILLTFLWLGFLPNSFYIVSDLIHVHLTGEINILFDVVLFISCIFNAYVFGFMSLYIVHRELLKRLEIKRAHLAIGAVILASSFAIYLGRYLRWNTWDIFIQPLGLIFDITDRIINPIAHPQAFVTTIIFSLLLGSMYWVVYEFVRLLSSKHL